MIVAALVSLLQSSMLLQAQLVPSPMPSMPEITAACDWAQGDANCSSYSSCIPLPEDISKGRHCPPPLRSVCGSDAEHQKHAHTGVCIQNPESGHSLPLGLGKPLFYFPLSHGSLASWPWGTRIGMPHQVVHTIEQDCSRGQLPSGGGGQEERTLHENRQQSI
jgi:hypothetical protein